MRHLVEEHRAEKQKTRGDAYQQMSRLRQSRKARGEGPGHRERDQREDHEPREVDRDRDAENRAESKCVCRSVSFHCFPSQNQTAAALACPASSSAMTKAVLTAVSGLSEIELIPSSTNQAAKPGSIFLVHPLGVLFLNASLKDLLRESF